ncbi:hypothetical protein TCDM_02892 [Trypanosoma cruzi Dm28c]|uniref:Uncharacterized protein n=1 Tax=Trypanosoma cruzi Dm28c TaxID=1416333 RepID=V5BKK8_TRYCR|nr:hypothetical protein TCDM_02892 [Trypanosoma cruzi Dm28c]
MSRKEEEEFLMRVVLPCRRGRFSVVLLFTLQFHFFTHKFVIFFSSATKVKKVQNIVGEKKGFAGRTIHLG